jgi:hypothetical protein
LEEAEGLSPTERKPVLEAAKLAFEEALESVVALDDPWTHRVDVASLNMNLALVSIWQGKPKAANRFLRQVKEIELPPNHLLVDQIALTEERVNYMMEEKKKKKK